MSELKYKIALNDHVFRHTFKNETELNNYILSLNSSYDYVHVNRDEKVITANMYKNRLESHLDKLTRI